MDKIRTAPLSFNQFLLCWCSRFKGYFFVYSFLLWLLSVNHYLHWSNWLTFLHERFRIEFPMSATQHFGQILLSYETNPIWINSVEYALLNIHTFCTSSMSLMRRPFRLKNLSRSLAATRKLLSVSIEKNRSVEWPSACWASRYLILSRTIKVVVSLLL